MSFYLLFVVLSRFISRFSVMASKYLTEFKPSANVADAWDLIRDITPATCASSACAALGLLLRSTVGLDGIDSGDVMELTSLTSLLLKTTITDSDVVMMIKLRNMLESQLKIHCRNVDLDVNYASLVTCYSLMRLQIRSMKQINTLVDNIARAGLVTVMSDLLNKMGSTGSDDVVRNLYSCAVFEEVVGCQHFNETSASRSLISKIVYGHHGIFGTQKQTHSLSLLMELTVPPVIVWKKDSDRCSLGSSSGVSSEVLEVLKNLCTLFSYLSVANVLLDSGVSSSTLYSSVLSTSGAPSSRAEKLFETLVIRCLMFDDKVQMSRGIESGERSNSPTAIQSHITAVLCMMAAIPDGVDKGVMKSLANVLMMYLPEALFGHQIFIMHPYWVWFVECSVLGYDDVSDCLAVIIHDSMKACGGVGVNRKEVDDIFGELGLTSKMPLNSDVYRRFCDGLNKVCRMLLLIDA